MIKSSDLINLLKDRSVDFTKEELEKLIENELAKNESEMDTELVECCIDVLNEKKTPAPAKQKKPAYIKFIFFAAAAAVLIFVNVAVFGKLGSAPAPVAPATDVTASIQGTTGNTTLSSTVTSEKDKTTEKSYDDLTENTSRKEEQSSLKGEVSTTVKAESTLKGNKGDTTLPPSVNEQLKSNGFSDIALPGDVIILKIKTQVKFSGNSAEFDSTVKGKKLNITITKGQGNSASTTHKTESIAEETVITVNSVPVTVKTENNISTMTYSIKNNSYRIVFESSHQEATELAKTIL